jgi:hypothetical protein
MRCPVCKADNNQGPSCRRCKADLGLLFALERRRAWALTEAGRALAEGDYPRAAERAAEAERLRAGDDARRLRALAALLSRDFARAWECYRALQVEEVAPADRAPA